MESPNGGFAFAPRSQYCFASDFVRQERQKIPSHQTACHTSLEADHRVGSARELRYSQALIEVPAAAGAVGEVRDLRVGADRAGHPAGSRAEVEGGPVHRHAHLPGRQAGRPGCAVGVSAGATRDDRGGRGAGGWPVRRACALLGLDDTRAARWAARRAAGQLDDKLPGGNPLHGLLAWERQAVIGLFEDWHEIDKSHRKLAHRGSRLALVHVSESTVRRVLAEEGLVIDGPPAREPVPRSPWPDWLTGKPNSIWAYDFTHWTRARHASIAILDVVSRKWLATLTSAEESSTQVEACFLAALDAEDLLGRADELATAALRKAITSGDRDAVHDLAGAGQVP